MCEKRCDIHGRQDKMKLYCSLFVAIIVITGLVILLTLAILQSHKPKFIVQDATVTALSLSGSCELLNCDIQVTVNSENPNERIGIYFEKLDIYASYRSQQITLPTELPRSYLGHKDTTTWSPFINGNSVPVSVPMAAALGEDLYAGGILINIKIDGRLKWKVRSWVSGKYRINVNCPGYITFSSRSHGISQGVGIKYQFVRDCTVDVAR